jgi:LmbE family N-acetylglucosaminyl deacetylase
VPATGFALACQLDKGLPPDVDYMAIRREEDRHAAAILGFTVCHWLDLLEAPHRGYESAPALFGALHPGDTIVSELAPAFATLYADYKPDLVLAPQGLGLHVDHRQVIAAALQCFDHLRMAFYRDTPYAIREPGARPLPGLPAGDFATVNIAAALERKVAAAQAYESQVGFQFGGPAPLATALTQFARDEGAGSPAERFMGTILARLGLDLLPG